MTQSSNNGVSDQQQQTQKNQPAPATVGLGVGQQQWVAYHPRQPRPPVTVGQPGSGGGENKAIWVGDLHNWMDEDYLRNCFASTGEVASIKVIRNKQTGFSEGYGFVEFYSHDAAEKVFGDDKERTQAMNEMNGAYCSSRPMRIGAATPRKSTAYQQGGYMSNGGSKSDGDSNNTTIFVGGLDPSVSDEDLRQPFIEYGEIISVKIPAGKGCGFVQFANRANAEEALQKLNGTTIGKQTVRLSWGRNPANKQMRHDFGNQWLAAYYGGGQIYNGYGYGYGYAMQPPYVPSMYGASYGGYGMHGAHQQQVN
ncbi:putative RNA recognition motif domain, nucleotide-binding alpha-beta plait domain superfamily [Helianthus annuus]|nr:putative RNA recognition motif domain, nucleotide-binding alpha-beta plait domain superfamily [Helianthus annuus]KAJ0543718.1 putative RNA recognition motif domain, nucleotide-binding alpha-beta plait domain superfamily [Helianthus annuus]KAJ0708773.1 putative RNA recognition motif domain, nucleotide-binding alpha-beta plait domain superfamily [Helianthus annuus]KAJ0712687.1 putative RNA recognition motif domain, nucleotide-binding alpha-beta plait domain superfamily [Helianthus annuus]